MPQNVGSVKDVTSKNKHRVDTLNSAKLIVLTKRGPRARSFSPQLFLSRFIVLFRVRAFSILRTRLSWSLEQANFSVI